MNHQIFQGIKLCFVSISLFFRLGFVFTWRTGEAHVLEALRMDCHENKQGACEFDKGAFIYRCSGYIRVCCWSVVVTWSAFSYITIVHCLLQVR